MLFIYTTFFGLLTLFFIFTMFLFKNRRKNGITYYKTQQIKMTFCYAVRLINGI